MKIWKCLNIKMMKLLKIQSHGKNEQIRTILKTREMQKHFRFTKKKCIFYSSNNKKRTLDKYN